MEEVREGSEGAEGSTPNNDERFDIFGGILLEYVW